MRKKNAVFLLLTLTGLSFGIAGATVYRYVQDTGQLLRRYEAVREVALRTSLRDAVIGTRLPPLRLYDAAGQERLLHEGGGRHAIWFVDIERCPNCLEDMPAWQHLTSRIPELRTTLVLVGTDTEGAAAAIQTMRIRGQVLVDPEAKVRTVVPLSVPSVYVLTDEEGVITMVDGRSARKSCGWSFPGQVASVFGPGNSDWIRSF